MNQLFLGQVLCSDSLQDGFWLDVLYEAADLIPTFELKPLVVFVGREAASDIYRLLPATRHHRAFHDATALMEVCRAFFEAGTTREVDTTLSYAKAMSPLKYGCSTACATARTEGR